jgi:hypothetical protein
MRRFVFCVIMLCFLGGCGVVASVSPTPTVVPATATPLPVPTATPVPSPVPTLIQATAAPSTVSPETIAEMMTAVPLDTPTPGAMTRERYRAEMVFVLEMWVRALEELGAEDYAGKLQMFEDMHRMLESTPYPPEEQVWHQQMMDASQCFVDVYTVYADEFAKPATEQDSQRIVQAKAQHETCTAQIPSLKDIQ